MQISEQLDYSVPLSRGFYNGKFEESPLDAMRCVPVGVTKVERHAIVGDNKEDRVIGSYIRHPYLEGVGGRGLVAI